MAKLVHKVPCDECPWRKTASRGKLGGYPATMYADAVQGNELPACHMKDYGITHPKTAFCAGAMATAANACILPWKAPGGAEAVKEVGKLSYVFGSPREFFEYHTGGIPYISFVHRMLGLPGAPDKP